MFSAAHHWRAVQPVPSRPRHPARRVELHLHEGPARAEAEVLGAVRVVARVDVRVAVRRAGDVRVARPRRQRVRTPARSSHSDHAQPECDAPLEVGRAAAAVLASDSSADPSGAACCSHVVARAGRVRVEEQSRLVVADVGGASCRPRPSALSYPANSSQFWSGSAHVDAVAATPVLRPRDPYGGDASQAAVFVRGGSTPRGCESRSPQHRTADQGACGEHANHSFHRAPFRRAGCALDN